MMGFGEAQIQAEMRQNDKRTLNELVDVLTGMPPESPQLSQQDSTEDNAMLRQYLSGEKATGVQLSLEQNNFLLLADHRNGTQYECEVCYC